MLLARLVPASRFLPSSVSREFAERFDAADHHQEIVLAAEREHGIDEIVTRALVAELDLQAVGEEGEKIATQRLARALFACLIVREPCRTAVVPPIG